MNNHNLTSLAACLILLSLTVFLFACSTAPTTLLSPTPTLPPDLSLVVFYSPL